MDKEDVKYIFIEYMCVNSYVSPMVEVVKIHHEGTVLSGSLDVGLGFDFEDGEMTEGDEIIIGG